MDVELPRDAMLRELQKVDPQYLRQKADHDRRETHWEEWARTVPGKNGWARPDDAAGLTLAIASVILEVRDQESWKQGVALARIAAQFKDHANPANRPAPAVVTVTNWLTRIINGSQYVSTDRQKAMASHKLFKAGMEQAMKAERLSWRQFAERARATGRGPLIMTEGEAANLREGGHLHQQVVAAAELASKARPERNLLNWRAALNALHLPEGIDFRSFTGNQDDPLVLKNIMIEALEQLLPPGDSRSIPYGEARVVANGLYESRVTAFPWIPRTVPTEVWGQVMRDLAPADRAKRRGFRRPRNGWIARDD